MQSLNLTVQLKASNALSTFIYNNSRVHLYINEEYQLSFSYFEKFLENNNDYIRCTAAFQVCREKKNIFGYKYTNIYF